MNLVELAIIVVFGGLMLMFRFWYIILPLVLIGMVCSAVGEGMKSVGCIDDCQMATQNLKEAVRILDQLKSECSSWSYDPRLCHNNEGTRKTRYERMLHLVKQAKCEKLSSEIYNIKGIIHHHLGQYQEALEDYDKSLSINSSDTVSNNRRKLLGLMNQ